MGNWQSTRRRRASLLDSASAGDVERVRELVHGDTTGHCLPRAGIEVDVTDESGRTALMLAAASGHEDVVRLLVDCGASVNARDSNDTTPLRLAVENGHVGVVRYLFEHGPTINVQLLVENVAAVSTDSDSVKALLDLATENGHLDVVRYLADCSSGPIATDIDGKAELELVQAAFDSDAEAHRVDVGVNVQGRDAQGVALVAANGGGLETIPEDEDQQQTPAQPAAASQWFLDRKELQVDTFVPPLGRGGFGQVYRAKWLNSDVVVKEVFIDRGKKQGLKVFKPSWEPPPSALQVSQTTQNRTLFSTADGRSIMQVFRREANIWFRLNHPHVVRLFGACDDTSGGHKPIFVSEYATNGPLDEYLLAHPEQLWQKLHEAALGIQYLHERGIVHGDLKCDNIVVGSDLKAKLTDFGLSSVTRQVGVTSVQISGAVQWVAPECLGKDHKPATIESDVYSLGMCIIQALRIVEAARLNKDVYQYPPFPWENVPNAAVIFHVKRLKRLPSRPLLDTCTDEQWALVKSMCAFEPDRRIKIARVAGELAELASNGPETQWGNLASDREFEAQWRKVQDAMSRSDGNTLRQQAFQDLQVIVSRLHQPHQPLRLIREARRLLDSFLSNDLFERYRILTAGSTKSSRNMHIFCEKLRSMWFRLSQPDDNEVRAMPEDIPRVQVDLVVSEIPRMWFVSADFESEGDRRAFLEFLNLEVERNAALYSPEELNLIQSAYDGIGHEQLSYGKPRWFAPSYEVEIDDWVDLGRRGFESAFFGKWLDSDVVIKQLRMPSEFFVNSWHPWLSLSSGNGDADPDSQRAAELEVIAKDKEAIKSFVQEAEIWFSLSHPHVVRLYGACHIGPPFFMCEYAPNGPLNEYLRWNPDQIWEKLLETALGVQYLHECRVIHGNLKCNNIVVGGDGKAKVTDYGLNLTKVSVQLSCQIPGGWHFVAPECLKGEKLSFQSNIYSLGMCVVEALRLVDRWNGLPWGDLNNEMVKFYVTRREDLPPRPSNSSDSQWELVKAMGRSNPQDRIPISCVVAKLQKEAHLARRARSKQPGVDQPTPSAA